jgi:hypothetical protein
VSTGVLMFTIIFGCLIGMSVWEKACDVVASYRNRKRQSKGRV